MNAPRLRAGRPLAFLFLITHLASSALAANLSGVVRDEQGIPVVGASISVAGGENSLNSFTTASDGKGAYHFLSLSSGSYHLEVSRSGFQTMHSGVVSISDPSADVTMDLTLTRQPSGADTGAGKPTEPHPQFEAAGVRGLIDPGGYSAPAGAAAASGMIKGIADIKRTGNGSETSEGVGAACSLEPGLKKAVDVNPQSAEAKLKLGEFYLAHGQAAKAVLVLERARSLNESDHETVEQLAAAYLKTGRFESAQKLLIPFVARQDTPETRRLLAHADEGTGKFAEASQDYQIAAKEQPSEENFFGVGYELILAGQPKDAEQAFQAGSSRYPQSIQLLIGLGTAQFLGGHQSESVQSLLHAVELNPSDPRPYPFLAGVSEISSADAEKVHAALEHFLSIAPDNPQASYYYALNLLHERAPDRDADRRVEDLLKHAILLDPSLANAHFQLGVLYARREDYQDAARELEIAVRLSPNLKEAHYRLAIAYRQTGRPDLSAKEMQVFRETHDASAGGVSIDQFISVFNEPDSVASKGALCPGDSP
jgi:Flp pilus assembly protein TadD